MNLISRMLLEILMFYSIIIVSICASSCKINFKRKQDTLELKNAYNYDSHIEFFKFVVNYRIYKELVNVPIVLVAKHRCISLLLVSALVL